MGDSVSLGYTNPRRELKYNEQQSIFDKIWGVWIANEALSWVFDMSSQSNKKLRSKTEK